LRIFNRFILLMAASVSLSACTSTDMKNAGDSFRLFIEDIRVTANNLVYDMDLPAGYVPEEERRDERLPHPKSYGTRVSRSYGSDTYETSYMEEDMDMSMDNMSMDNMSMDMSMDMSMGSIVTNLSDQSVQIYSLDDYYPQDSYSPVYGSYYRGGLNMPDSISGMAIESVGRNIDTY